MKAIRKEDGKEIEVELYYEKQYIATEAEEGEHGRRFYYENALIIKEAVDWEAFHREAAKDILCAIISTTNRATPKDVTMAIEIADELIKQLKEEQK